MSTKHFLLAVAPLVATMTTKGQAILAPTEITAPGLMGPGGQMHAVGNHLYFLGVTLSYTQLWCTDGTTAGTRQLTNSQSHAEFPNATSSSIYYNSRVVTEGGQRWYFTHKPGEAEPRRVNYSGHEWDMFYGIPLKDQLIFPRSGSNIYITRGTEAPVQLSDRTMAIESRCAWGDKVAFAALPPGGETDVELYVSNGTAAGTRLVKDIWPGTKSSYPRNLTVIGKKLYFTAESKVEGVRELWVSDGTEAGTKFIVKLGRVKVEGSMLEIAPGTNKFYFATNESGENTHNNYTANGAIWRSDGTAAGTFKLAFMNTAIKGYAELLPMLDGKVRFFANSTTNVRSIYRFTPATGGNGSIGEATVDQILPQGQNTRGIAVVNQKIFYSVGDKMWAYNPTSFAQVRPTNTQGSWTFNNSGRNLSWAVLNDWLYFMGNYNGAGAELYKVR